MDEVEVTLFCFFWVFGFRWRVGMERLEKVEIGWID